MCTNSGICLSKGDFSPRCKGSDYSQLKLFLGSLWGGQINSLNTVMLFVNISPYLSNRYVWADMFVLHISAKTSRFEREHEVPSVNTESIRYLIWSLSSQPRSSAQPTVVQTLNVRLTHLSPMPQVQLPHALTDPHLYPVQRCRWRRPC